MRSPENMEYVDDMLEPELPESVSFGGGSGLSNLIRGERAVLSDEVHTTAIIAESDDGGNSKEVSETFNIVPPGDLRQALVALLTDENQKRLLDDRMDDDADEQTLMAHHIALSDTMLRREGADESRIEEILDETDRLGRMLPTLANAPYGNLMIAAATKLHDGKASEGMATLVDQFGVKNASIIPVTDRRHRLALLRDGRPVAVGQSAIDNLKMGFDGLSVGYTYDMEGEAHEIRLAELETNPAVLKAIGRAATLKSGVGSVLTSVLATTSASGIREAAELNSEAVVISVPNLILQDNERDTSYADSWQMHNQITRVAESLGEPEIVILNGNTELLRKLGHIPLEMSDAQIDLMVAEGADILQHDLVGFRKTKLTDELAHKRSPVIHRSEVVAEVIRDKVLSRRTAGVS